MNPLCDPAVKKAFVGAHCDDESLWAAGLILRYPHRWTVISCSIPTRDPIRGWKFHAACDVLGGDGRVLSITETRGAPLTSLDQIDLSPYGVVVTHGAVGEYKHPHHVQVHEFVKASAPAKVLAIHYGNPAAPDLVLELDDEEWQRKLSAIRCYDHLMHWGGKRRPTWDALIDEYGTPGQHFGFDLRRESYVEIK